MSETQKGPHATVAKNAKQKAKEAIQQRIVRSPFGEVFSERMFRILCVLGGLCVRLLWWELNSYG
jgi:hypothetical protein